MKKGNKLLILGLLFFCMSLMPLSAVTIKLGSMFPEGSSWDLTLKKIAAEWRSISGGRVNLKIYPGGIAGSEEDMIRKMRIGQLDSAVLTSVGMNKIVSDSLVMSLPFFVQTEEELDFVVDELTPLFDDDFHDKGFQVLVWSKSGWINFFANKEIQVPDDLRRIKLAVSPGEQEMIQAFKELRFNVIPLSLNDTLMGLQSGMIDAFYTAPMAAAAYQWFALAPYMNPLKVSPVIGGIVISERAWKKIPARYHEDLRDSMRSVEREFFQETEKMNQEALRIMRENGLQEISINEEHREAWLNLFSDGYGMIVGNGLPISLDTYEEISRRLDEFRKSR